MQSHAALNENISLSHVRDMFLQVSGRFGGHVGEGFREYVEGFGDSFRRRLEVKTLNPMNQLEKQLIKQLFFLGYVFPKQLGFGPPNYVLGPKNSDSS